MSKMCKVRQWTIELALETYKKKNSKRSAPGTQPKGKNANSRSKMSIQHRNKLDIYIILPFLQRMWIA